MSLLYFTYQNNVYKIGYNIPQFHIGYTGRVLTELAKEKNFSAEIVAPPPPPEMIRPYTPTVWQHACLQTEPVFHIVIEDRAAATCE